MHDELGTKTLGAFLSPTPGEIHLRELRRQTRLDEVELYPEHTLDVLALGADGVPVQVDLGLAPKWSTRGWELQLACPLCREPSRVLRERDRVFCCARCPPRSSPHHRFKNCRYWTHDGGKLTAEIVRKLMTRADQRAAPNLVQLATTLACDTVDQAEVLLPTICSALSVGEAS